MKMATGLCEHAQYSKHKNLVSCKMREGVESEGVGIRKSWIVLLYFCLTCFTRRYRHYLHCTLHGIQQNPFKQENLWK